MRRGYAGQGGMGGWDPVHSHTNPECRFTVCEESVMGGGGGLTPGGGGGTPYDDQCTMLGGLGSIFELGSIP